MRRAAAAAAAGAGGPQDQWSCRRGGLGPVCMSGGVGNIRTKRRRKKSSSSSSTALGSKSVKYL